MGIEWYFLSLLKLFVGTKKKKLLTLIDSLKAEVDVSVFIARIGNMVLDALTFFMR